MLRESRCSICTVVLTMATSRVCRYCRRSFCPAHRLLHNEAADPEFLAILARELAPLPVAPDEPLKST